MIHKELLSIENQSPIHLGEISKTFQNLEKKMAFHYCNYLKEYDERYKQTMELQKSIPTFNTKLVQFSRLNNHMNIYSLMILPVGRIPRLRMIFKDLLKNCFCVERKEEIRTISEVLDSILHSFSN
jgi:hypothetical protein